MLFGDGEKEHEVGWLVWWFKGPWEVAPLGSVAFLEEVCHLGGWLWGFKAGLNVALFLLPADPEVELSVIILAPCLPKCSHASLHDD